MTYEFGIVIAREPAMVNNAGQTEGLYYSGLRSGHCAAGKSFLKMRRTEK